MVHPIGEADALQERLGSLAPSCRAYPREGKGQLEILGGGERLEQAKVLEDETDGGPAKLGKPVAPQLSEIVARDLDAAGLRVLQASDDREQGRLPGTRGPDERDVPGPIDAERDACEDGELTVASRVAVAETLDLYRSCR
jgi:hypothetical protein